MKTHLFAAAAVLMLATPVLAQDNTMAGMADGAKLPDACETAAAAGGKMDMAKMMEGMDGMAGGMDEVQKANMDAMMQMHGPMMRAMMIKDADLSFNCGMIAHHQGAIAMAEVELKLGKDEASRKMAQMIIDAQKKEIAEMTDWVNQHGH